MSVAKAVNRVLFLSAGYQPTFGSARPLGRVDRPPNPLPRLEVVGRVGRALFSCGCEGVHAGQSSAPVMPTVGSP